MPYIINLTSKKVSVFIDNTIPQGKVIEILSNKNIGIEKDTEVVFLERKKEGHSFTEYGIVLSVESVGLENEQYKVKHTIIVSIKGELKESNSLNELTYSLYKIYRFTNPYKHFARSYSFIYDFDYVTIVSGQIFISRTAIGKLFNALHDDHKYHFIVEAINELGKEYFINPSYDKIFHLLKEYIEQKILEPGYVLIDCYNLIKNVIPENYQKEIGFFDDKESRSDTVFSQYPVIQDLILFEKQANILNATNVNLNESRESQQRFQEYFHQALLPFEY